MLILQKTQILFFLDKRYHALRSLLTFCFNTIYSWSQGSKIAYGFGGPSEKMSVSINFQLQNTNLVAVLSKICTSFTGHV